MPSKYARKKDYLSTRKTFVIAVEGQKDEVTYFEHLKTITTKNIQILIAQDAKNYSSAPSGGVFRLEKYIQSMGTEFNTEIDEAWLVADVDRYQKQGNLQNAIKDCNEKGYSFAISNPSFDLWLVFHFERPSLTENRAYYKRRWKAFIQKKEPQNLGCMPPLVASAIERAKNQDPGGRWPQTTGTHVYKLVERLISS